jgi:CubicO group peptidase (beta-lactamase class C family)
VKTSGQTGMQAIDSILEKQVKGIKPGIAVGIVKDGQIVYEKYAGYSNLEHQIPVDSNTSFNIASNAKQFTAFMILYLEELGKLKISDDLRTYLPEFFPEIKSPITIANLLNHTSGIRDFYDLMSLQGDPWWQQVGLDNKDALRLLKKQTALNFEPGTQYLYSNSNYTLLTEVVNKVLDQSFPEATTTLFDSLGMPNTRFQTNYMAVIPNKALPYSDWGDGVWQQYPMVTSLYGDGFLFTTLRDQLIWEEEIQKQKTDNLPSDLLKRSQKPITNSSIKEYGFGLEFGEYKGKEIVYHSGATGSYSAYFIRIPSESVSVVVMTNNGSIWTEGLAKEILDEIMNLKSKQSYPTMPENLGAKPSLEEVTGAYQLEDGTLIKLYQENDKLFRIIYNREPIEIVHEKENVFRYSTIENLKMVFIKNESNTYDFALYMPDTPVRIAPRLPKEDALTNWVKVGGTYVNDEIGVEFQLQYLEGAAFEVIMKERIYTAELLRNNWIQMGDYKLNIERDKSGDVSALLLDQNRLRNVRFTKQL